jgi:hypothetical protein
MPKEWRDCVEGIKKSGKSEDRAYAICTANFMKKHGITPQEADKKGWLEEIFEKLSLEDLELLDEEELAYFAEVSEDSETEINMLEVWNAPTSRKDVPKSHFFWPEQKKYPYRNPDGSVNCAGVMAAWKMAHGARSGQEAPDWLISRIKPYHDRCLKKKAGEDADFGDIYDREFSMPNVFFKTTSPNEVKLEDQEERKTIKIQVLRHGAFQHPQYGKIKFDDKTFESFIKNFNEKIPQEHIAYDFKHRPDWGAAAWLKSLFTEGDGLWADVELTRRGAESLKDKEFIYFSTEYVDNYKDLETGKSYGPTILGGGLTNRPFIKGMAPTLMSEDKEEMFIPVEESKSQKEVDVTAQELQKAIADLRQELNGLIEKADSKEEIQKAFSTVGEQIKSLEAKLDETMKNDEEVAKKLEEANAALAKAEEEKKSLSESLSNAIKDKDALDVQVRTHQEKLRKAGVEVFCKGLSDQGIWPATVEVIKAILVAGSNEKVVTLSEGEGDNKKNVEFDLKSVIEKIVASIPDDFKVSMGEETENGEPTGDYTAEKIQKLADEAKISYADMLLKLSVDKKI